MIQNGDIPCSLPLQNFKCFILPPPPPPKKKKKKILATPFGARADQEKMELFKI